MTCCCEMYVNIIVQTTFSLPGVGFLLWFATRTFHELLISAMPALYSWFVLPDNIWWRAQTWRLLTGQCLQAPCHVFDLSSHIFLDILGPETKFHAHVKKELKCYSFVYFNLIQWVLDIRRTDRIFWTDWSQAFHKCKQLLNFVILCHYYL